MAYPFAATYLPMLCLAVATVDAQGDTVIENKNVNVILNLDAEEVVKELWKVIESRLRGRGNNTANTRTTVRDLMEAVSPLVSPNRRGLSQPSAYELANDLDRITRRSLSRDAPDRSSLDEEIMTRDIVADMMIALKQVLPTVVQRNVDRLMDETNSRRAMDYTGDDDDYLNVMIKVRRSDLRDALQ